MKSLILGVLAVVAGAAVNLTATSAQTGSQLIVRPGSPEAAEFLRKLQDAEYSDRGNSSSYSSDDPSVGHYYARKADEVSALIKRLEGGNRFPAKKSTTRSITARPVSTRVALQSH
jgi:hypothetical protein